MNALSLSEHIHWRSTLQKKVDNNVTTWAPCRTTSFCHHLIKLTNLKCITSKAGKWRQTLKAEAEVYQRWTMSVMREWTNALTTSCTSTDTTSVCNYKNHKSGNTVYIHKQEYKNCHNHHLHKLNLFVKSSSYIWTKFSTNGKQH